MESKEQYSLIQEPRGAGYHGLLRWAKEAADTVLLVVRRDAVLSRAATTLLERLEPYLSTVTTERAWPGTTLLGDEASIFRYRLGPDCCEILATACDGLYEWQHPALPEDLCLLVGNTPLLTTVAHEGFGFLDLTETQCRGLQASVGGLLLFRGRFMPSTLEPYRLFGCYLDDDSLALGEGIDAALRRYVESTERDKLVEVLAAIREALLNAAQHEREDAILSTIAKGWEMGAIVMASLPPRLVLERVAQALERQMA